MCICASLDSCTSGRDCRCVFVQFIDHTSREAGLISHDIYCSILQCSLIRTFLFLFRKIMRSLGEAGVVETETEALLIDNEVDFEEFSSEVEDCLPKEHPWTIPRVRPTAVQTAALRT